jgi:lipopolysaccharide/colanic/teichoic acid biosynthesis glycosyltransferase
MASRAFVHPYYFSWQKRALDVVVALVLHMVALPVMMILGLIILLTTGWPVLYGQVRLGKYRRPFTLYKLRTMYQGAELDQARYRQQNQAPEPMFKLMRDPRFVGIGAWASRTGLDELPQLWNILKGEMSLVGPRPLPAREADKLSRAWQFRYLVAPGIFSQWSLANDRHESLGRWRELEIETVEYGSVGNDLWMMVRLIRKHWVGWG